MTVAIKRDNGDLFWFDTVLSFNRQLTGSVSKHPLEDGAVITDHTTIDNEIITLNGVLSDADFNLNRPIISQPRAELFGITDKEFVNNTPITRARVEAGSTEEILYNNILIEDTDGLARFFPESIGQFFGTNVPSVTFDPRTPDKVRPATAVQAVLVTMFNDRESFTLLNFVGGQLEDAFDNCVMTSLGFPEDAESGDAIYPNITIERVKYAVSTSVRINKQVSPDIAKKAASQQNKGKQTTPTTSKDDPSLNPQQPQDNTDKTRPNLSVLGGG